MKRRFYIQILGVLVSAICLSSIYYYWLCAGLRQSRENFPGKISHILYDSDHYDAIFLGSSRVRRNIDPLVFTSATGIKSYNAGMDGACFTTIALFAKKIIQKHGIPGYIFINLDPYTLERDSSLFYYPAFYPHTADPDVYALSKIEPTLRYGRYAPFLALSYIDDYLKGVSINSYLTTSPRGDTDTMPVQNGFEKITTLEYKGGDDSFDITYHYDPANLNKLDSLCQYFDQKGCKVFFIMAPMWKAMAKQTENTKLYYKYLRGIESKYSISELNYYTDTRFSRENFFDHTHLNYRGANLYTQMLADTILQLQRKEH